jgi:hypothetical protein
MMSSHAKAHSFLGKPHRSKYIGLALETLDCMICLDGIPQIYKLSQPAYEQDSLTCLKPEALNNVDISTGRTPQDLVR